MAVIGLVTNEGLSKSIEAELNVGWKIHPLRFAVSATAGDLSATRTYASMNTLWYDHAIGGVVDMSPNTLQFSCTIPPGAVGSLEDINEIYLIAQDNFAVDFLLGIGQPEDTIVYDPSGSINLRLQITIVNVDISSVYQFDYTQAVEISEHNIDPNSHPDLRALLTSFGGKTVYVDTTPYDAEVGDLIYVNSSSLGAPITINLPKEPVDGAGILAWDVGGDASTHPVTFVPDTDTLMGEAVNGIIDTNRGIMVFNYNATDNDWNVRIPPIVLP